MHATFRQRLRIRRLARLPQCVSYSTARTHTPISWDVLFENGGKVREGTQTTSNIPGLITGWTISKDVSGGALLQVEPSHVEGEVAKSLGEITDANASGSNKLEYSLKELLSVARNRPLPELLPLISSLISDQKLEIADALFHSLGRFHPEEWVTMSKTHLVNQFIDGYLERGNWGEMLKWKDVLFTGQLSATRPDSYSFALMLRYCLLSAKNPSDSSQLAQNLIHNADGMLEVEKECQKLVEEAAVYSITVSDIFGTKLLSAGEVQKISQFLNVSQEDAARAATRKEVDLNEILDPLLATKEGDSTKIKRNLSHLPEVYGIQSKSDNISYLRECLASLGEVTTESMYLLQERLEKDCIAASARRLFNQIEQYQKLTKTSKPSKSLLVLISEWMPVLIEHIQSTLDRRKGVNLSHEEIKAHSVATGSAIIYTSMLKNIEPAAIALIALQELVRAPCWDPSFPGIPVNRLSRSIGDSLERELIAAQIRKKEFLKYTHLNTLSLVRLSNNRRGMEEFIRKKCAEIEHNADAIREGWIPRWSPKLRMEIGVYVISLAVDALKYKNPVTKVEGPAFKHEIVYRDGSSLGVVKAMSRDLFTLISTDAPTIFFDPWAMPMLVPPKPWITHNNGGYLHQRVSCMRLKDEGVHLALVHHADKQGQLEPLYRGLDALGATAWRVNQNVLKIVLELWNKGINVATLEEPKTAEVLEYRPRDTFETQEDYVAYVRKASDARLQVTNNHSTMCDINYKLEIARQFAGLPFYLPHSVDFRGRAYPIPPHLSHVGADLSRGLLYFDRAFPLGARGLHWLKVQLANTAGYDKASFGERVTFTEERMKEIFSSVDDPFHPDAWWRKAEEPWQCLAACFELAAAMRSPNPEAYESRLPVQQDGSCNGLQHYAALGRDVFGATQVNLAPSDRPQDVYAAVASLVSARIERDKLDPSHPIASKLSGKINRKIIKQPVMTNVYGVTRYGARLQINDRLKEYNVVEAGDLKAARIYLADAVFDSLGTIFEKAEAIQKWFAETAMEISKAVPPEVAAKFGTAVASKSEVIESGNQAASISDLEAKGDTSSGKGRGRRKMDPADRYPQTSVLWTTPLGLTVTQPYYKVKMAQLRTVLQVLNVRLSTAFDPIDALKQASAFPPNFIHSLDATHMFKTALACREADITFASVHDCFWTHAATVDDMNRLLREQFAELHSQPLLERLREEFLKLYQEYVVPETLTRSSVAVGDIRHIKVGSWRPIHIPPLPPRGDFDLSLVLKSDYFFS